MPSPRLAGLMAKRSRPSSWIAPPLGSTKPAIICRVVVLPQPDGPSRETNSPFSTAKVRPSTAVWVPKRLFRPSSDRKLITPLVHAPLPRQQERLGEGVARAVDAPSPSL